MIDKKDEKKKSWEEAITSTDLTHNSRRAWQTIRKQSNDPTTPNPPCLVNTNQVSHQSLINGQETMPTKPKRPILPHNQEGTPTMAHPFSEEEYKKCIAADNNRKDTLQALHTSFVNTAIDNMKDNRVLNNRPPSINDEETLSSRRQMTTLSQLRSGNCKLLNSYKKRLKQTNSSSCPDCGMDPQDVPHLFDCTAHTIDPLHVNLWDRPIETIRELSFLDLGNLD